MTRISSARLLAALIVLLGLAFPLLACSSPSSTSAGAAGAGSSNAGASGTAGTNTAGVGSGSGGAAGESMDDAGLGATSGAPDPQNLGTVQVVSAPSAACTSAGTLPTDGLNSLQVNSEMRAFIFHAPPGYDGKRALPLVMAFHGKGDMAANLDGYNFLFQKVGGADNVLVYPQALPDPKLQNADSFERDPADDLVFIDALLASLKSNVCFDTARVFAMGHSLGSTFVQTLACERGNEIRAIAPQAGDVGMTTGCVGSVAAWIGYGLQDSAGEVSASKARKDQWLAANHCDPMSQHPGDPAPPCLQYTCAAGYPVEWCEDPAGTHKWSPWMTQSIFDFFGSFVAR